jgi:hypothetical protein
MAQRVAVPAERWTYVLKSDRELPAEQQSRFTLRPLSMAERAAARDNLARVHVANGERIITHRDRSLAVELSLSHIEAIENFPAGDPKPWPADQPLSARLSYLELLGDEAVREIGNEIFDQSVAPAAAKNS